jgi:hypothetical protein
LPRFHRRPAPRPESPLVGDDPPPARTRQAGPGRDAAGRATTPARVEIALATSGCHTVVRMTVSSYHAGWKRLVAVLVVGMLVAAAGGRAIGATSQGSDSGKPHPGKTKRVTERHQPPTKTHGFIVSQTAHEVPPGPGHGRAVSNVARTGGRPGREHVRQSKHDHPSKERSHRAD